MTNIITKIVITFTNGIAIWLIGTDEPVTNSTPIQPASNLVTNWVHPGYSNLIVTNCWWTNWPGLPALTNLDQPVTNMVDEGIKGLAKSGRICEAIGHAWAPHVHTTLEYRPNAMGCEQCKVCGKHRTLYHQWSEQ